jgi:murein DD-endopeptidase MepM/ murein hydrolase activator NlpD
VKPSPLVEGRVEREVARAGEVLDRMDPSAAFDSAYLVSAIYYHDGFLDDYPDQRPDGNPARCIVARLSRLLTPERKNACIGLLHELWTSAGAPPAGPFVVPVHAAQPRARRRTHRYAIDLFAPEGSPVVSAGPGLVLLAESGWTSGDPFSTSSQEGGNSVIVFDPGADRFYRYCHLAAVNVSAGARVDAGQTIGRVGHTGVNASRRGHGRHLHFEINQYDGRTVHPLTYLQLRGLIKSRG